jgi:hypothetical protein
MAQRWRILGTGTDGAVVMDAVVDDEHGDGPEFFAHQALHVDNVVCVQIFEGDAPLHLNDEIVPIFHRCDPGVTL